MLDKDLLEAYWQNLAARYRRAMERWLVAKRITWLALLAGSLLVYYLVSKLGEALSILRP